MNWENTMLKKRVRKLDERLLTQFLRDAYRYSLFCGILGLLIGFIMGLLAAK